jgi:hypothetical protein
MDNRALLLEAANMIETLLPEAETGQCSLCSARKGSHEEHCSGKLLLGRLKAAASSSLQEIERAADKLWNTPLGSAR